MKQLFVFFAFFSCFTGRSQTQSLFISSHTTKLANTKAYLLEMCKPVEQEMLTFRPVKEEMMFREQLIHLCQNMCWLSSTYIKEEPNPLKITKQDEAIHSKDELIDLLNFSFDYTIRAIAELDEHSLSKEFTWNGGKLNKYQFLQLIHAHQSHHIGQLIVYLRLLSLKPPRYIGW